MGDVESVAGIDESEIAGQTGLARLTSWYLKRTPASVARSVIQKFGATLHRPGGLRALMLYASMPGLSLLNAAVGLLLPALLGPATFGHYAIAVTLFQYGLILDFGMSQLLDRKLPVLLAQSSMDELQHFAGWVLWVRLYVAVAALVGGGIVLGVMDLQDRLPFPFLPGFLSMLAGLLFMIALGPMAVWRATTKRSAFAGWNAACAIILAFGRPFGMLLDGLTGCFSMLAAGYAVLAIRLYTLAPLARADRPSAKRSLSLLAQGAPLFATSFIWAFYMTANRWVISFLADRVELGQFAFGANVVYLIVGAVGALAQLHYPAIVARASIGGRFSVSRQIARDLALLALAVALPTALGIVIGPHLIDTFYRGFSGSAVPLRRLLIAAPCLVVASWLMPLSLSTGARPWIEGLVIYPLALALLVGGTWTGFQAGGIAGAAWALAGSALPLMTLQLSNLRYIGLLKLADAAIIFSVASGATAGLAILAQMG